jgi:hypothetical protein
LRNQWCLSAPSYADVSVAIVSGVRYKRHILRLHMNAWRNSQHLIAFPDVLVEGELNPLRCRANGFSRVTEVRTT